MDTEDALPPISQKSIISHICRSICSRNSSLIGNFNSFIGKMALTAAQIHHTPLSLLPFRGLIQWSSICRLLLNRLWLLLCCCRPIRLCISQALFCSQRLRSIVCVLRFRWCFKSIICWICRCGFFRGQSGKGLPEWLLCMLSGLFRKAILWNFTVKTQPASLGGAGTISFTASRWHALIPTKLWRFGPCHWYLHHSSQNTLSYQNEFI